MEGKIFISYRRDDSSWSTGRIYDRLIKHFSEAQIFIDVDSIDLGDDFVAHIEQSVVKCDVLLAIVGQKWLETIQTKSREIDFVRLEIVAALKNNIRVIPILVENTKMPIADSLPEELKPLARRNAFLINYISFNSEMEKLVQSLKKIFSQKELKQDEQAKLIQMEGEHQTKPEGLSPLNKIENIRNPESALNARQTYSAAYIQGYKYDIFLSYSHIDNLKIFNEQKGWIEEFYSQLNMLLSRRIGKMDAVKFWVDHTWDTNRPFDSNHAEAIRQSAIMMCLVSPAYLMSEYCKKEFELFYNKAQQEPDGLVVGNRSRIIKVLLHNIPYEKLPKELGNTTGFNFNNSEYVEDYGDTVEVDSVAFKNNLKELKEAIVKLIEEFQNKKIKS